MLRPMQTIQRTLLPKNKLMYAYFENFVKNDIGLDFLCELYERLLHRNRKQWTDPSTREEVQIGILNEVAEIGPCKYLEVMLWKYKQYGDSNAATIG